MAKPGQWRILSAVENFAKYRDAWNRLNHRHFGGHPLGDACFVEPLIHYFGSARDYLAILEGPEEPLGMLLLTSSRFGVVGSFCPSQTELCPVLVESLDNLQSLIDRFPYSNLALQLYHQDPDYNVFPDIGSPLVYDIDGAVSTVTVALQGEFGAYWHSRSSKLRKNIGRLLRIMSQPAFEWRFVAVEAPAEVVAAVDRYGDLEIRGWKRAQGTAVHSSNDQGRFYREMMRRFAERGRAVVYELYFDDTLVSSQMAIANETILITLKTTYNEEHSQYSPGKLLDYCMIEHEFALHRYERIEFCTNAGHELIRWGTSTRPVSSITIYRNRLAQGGTGVYRELKQFGQHGG